MVLIGTLLFGCGVCWGQTPAPFVLETPQESILLGTGAALGVTALVLGAHVEPLTREAIDALDIQDINSFDRGAVGPHRETPAGDALLAASYAIPLSFLAGSETRRDWKRLAVMWTEAVFLQVGMNGIVKSTVQRTRPYVYDAATPLAEKTTVAARLSFYSGHTSQTATNCFFAARVFTAYATSKTLKVLAWSGAAIYPAVTGYLRQDSGHHFRTDVITGYCIGALVGAFVPELHRVRGMQQLHLAAIDGGMGLAVSFPWGEAATAGAPVP